MPAKPRVSIITPAYRHAGLIASTIASVQAQSISDWEMIVVDDGSDDGTAEVAESVGDTRVRVIRQVHRGIEGLAKTYNAALAASSAEVVAILEGDDLWKPEKLAIQLPDFDDESVVLSAGRFEISNLAGQKVALHPPPPVPEEALRNDPLGRAGFQMLRPQVLTFTWPLTVMMRKAALERAGRFQQPPGMPVVDLPTFLPMSAQGAWRFHPEVLGTWRRHERSVTVSRLPQVLNGAYRLASNFALSQGDAIGLTASERDQLDREWADFTMHRLTVLGRMLASEGEFPRATEAFVLARIFASKMLSKTLLRLAAAASNQGNSPEPWFRRARKPDWRTALLLNGVDPLVDQETNVADFVRHPF